MVEVAGKKVRGRQYPWGIVDVENPEHCDFIKLRSMLITHMQDLQEVLLDPSNQTSEFRKSRWLHNWFLGDPWCALRELPEWAAGQGGRSRWQREIFHSLDYPDLPQVQLCHPMVVERLARRLVQSISVENASHIFVFRWPKTRCWLRRTRSWGGCRRCWRRCRWAVAHDHSWSSLFSIPQPLVCILG